MRRFVLRKIQSPVPKQTQVYEVLKQAILDARFQPGEVLSIRALAASLGTSTMPVREAATRLITERALEALPNRGLRVPTLSPDEARDILRVRVVLEGMAASLAAETITAAEIVKLEQCELELERAVRRKQLPEAVQHNLKFHIGISRASRSKTVVSLIEALYLRYAPRIYTTMRRLPGNPAKQVHYIHTYHAAILAALRRADPQAARQAVEADLLDALRLESRPDLADQNTAPIVHSSSRQAVASKAAAGGRRSTSRRAHRRDTLPS
jgi:DNA-binding GntR family transcriptional regulator